MSDEIQSLEPITVESVSVIEAQSKAEIEIQISTAKRYPRDITRGVNNVIAYVTKDKEFAKTCVYSLPRAGKEITGPSVHLARFLASEYGNIMIDSKIIDIGDTMITAQSTVRDLQNNLTERFEVKRRITDKRGQRYADDMIIVTCNAALAIAARNAILHVIPAQYINAVYKAAQKAVIGDMSTEQLLLKRRAEILQGYYDTYGVTEAEILSTLEIETVNQIKEVQILQLIGLAQAIKDGDTTVAEAFGRTAKSETASATKEKVKKIMEEQVAKKKASQAPPQQTTINPETK